MRLKLSNTVIKDLQKIKLKDIKLFRAVEKHLTIFKADPTHPSLRLHKLSGKYQDTWSISITRKIRMIYILLHEEQEDSAYFVDIGTHDEVYKK